MTGHATDDRVRSLHDALLTHLAPEARSWLERALHDAATAAAAPAEDTPGLPAWEIRFATAGRHCRPRSAGAAPGAADDPAAAARILLLHALRADAPTLHRLYTRGSAAERRAVLLALPYLGHLGPDGLPLVEDALRSNDTTLIAAAVGPYAAARLPAGPWRQAVLKCLFTGVPVRSVASLADRARGDAELARMLTDYAAERTAAGRPVPDDLHHTLTLTAAAHTKEC